MTKQCPNAKEENNYSKLSYVIAIRTPSVAY